MTAGVYCITSPSGGRYIGSARDIAARWSVHRHGLRQQAHHNAPLLRAAGKYGLEALKFEVLVVCDERNLLTYEQIALDTLKPEYNLAKVAGRSAAGSKHWLGREHTDETRQKMRAAAERREAAVSADERAGIKAKISASLIAREAQLPEDVRSARAAARSGVVLTSEHKAKISAAGKGRQKSAETRARMAAAQEKNKGVPRSPEVRARIAEATRKAMAARKAAA